MHPETRYAAAVLPKLGDTIGGKYTLEVLLGRGGMGAVFRAKNKLTGRRVALKWMLPSMVATDELRARIFREARAMGRIEHPNVCAVYDVGEEGEAVFLVMELLEGHSLRTILASGPLPTAEACRILLSGMQGVAAAHLAGVVHRDLKPDNLFVCHDADGKRGITKVLDFGVSKILDPAGKDSGQLTKTGTSVGTPHYMSPEQVLGDREIDPRTDVYALGAILFEAIAGKVPHDAEGFSALMVRIATSDPESFLSLAPSEAAGLDPIVHKALARFRDDRYPDVLSFARAIEPFAGGARFEMPRARPRSEPPPEVVVPPRMATAATQLAGLTPSVASAALDIEVMQASSTHEPAGAAPQDSRASFPSARLPGSSGSGSSSVSPAPSRERSSRRALVPAALVLAMALAGWGVYWGTSVERAVGAAPAPVAGASPEAVPSVAATPEVLEPTEARPAPIAPAAPVVPVADRIEPVPPDPPATDLSATDPSETGPSETGPSETGSSRPRRRREATSVESPPVSESAPPETRPSGHGRSGTISTDDF